MMRTSLLLSLIVLKTVYETKCFRGGTPESIITDEKNLAPYLKRG